jgi:hypothetical protein
MNFRIIPPYGNLLLTADNASRAALADAYHYGGYQRARMLVSEAFHEQLYFVQPEDIGALTEAPILTDDLVYEDNGSCTVHGKIWWYPSYAVSDPFEELKNRGRVIFTYAPAEDSQS